MKSTPKYLHIFHFSYKRSSQR